MKTGFGRHFMADLYLCQNKLWETPDQFKIDIGKLITLANIAEIDWKFEIFNPNGIRVTGEIDNYSYVLIHIFPAEGFLAVDIFNWQSQIDFQPFSEGLIELFAPQVVAVETKIRAEHL